ncbi:MAG TPA: ABC transporter ATP-binding protein [Candidatus Limnocylindrales bacterium]
MATDAGALVATASGVALQAHGLSKRFGKKIALDAVDLTVPAGSVTALVGPNGAGKTTLIRVCMAFERPNGGGVEVDGVDPWKHRSEALRRVGYVPQTPAVYRGLDVDDHLAMARSLHSGFDAEYARKRLNQLGIPLDQRADTLSGGQAAQLGLAIALGTRAKVLLLDEPLANLDPLARREFIQVLIDAVKSDGSTALLSSHIVTDVEEACDRLVILGAGKVLLDCPLEEARQAHRLTDSKSPPPGGIAVGSFAGKGLTRLTLWRVPAEAGEGAAAATAPASLEEVVLGYLAAGRGTTGLQLN